MLTPLSAPFDPNALTAHQEAFARLYAQHGNGTEAHRAAYPDARHGRNSRHGAHAGELKKRGERARELLKNPKIAARVLELLPQRIDELSREQNDAESHHLANVLRTKAANLRVRLAVCATRPQTVQHAAASHGVALAASPEALGADQLADLVRLAARADMPANVRREALAAALPQLEALHEQLTRTVARPRRLEAADHPGA